MGGWSRGCGDCPEWRCKYGKEREKGRLRKTRFEENTVEMINQAASHTTVLDTSIRSLRSPTLVEASTCTVQIPIVGLLPCITCTDSNSRAVAV